MRRRNPGTTQELIIPVSLVCNTTDELLFSNIEHNSRLDKEWLRLDEAHGRIAILCGSGPSIADHLDEIRQHKRNGGVIFALNGCAKFLYDNDIMPDYQVIVDAREQTADLIGPANEHLFASQVDPKCFERVPNARLWHLQIVDIEEHFPEYEDGYVLIGGATSVGVTATCLAYAMGYRSMHCYGYDSSHKEYSGHAFDQPMNAEDPLTVVNFNGKYYVCSYTMKSQAEKFQETARALKDHGCAIEVHGYGLLPDIYNTPAIPDQDKYLAMWNIPEYRVYSPGENAVELFMSVVQPKGSIGDFGCGTGRGGYGISRYPECDVSLIDFAENCRDDEVKHLPFHQRDLTQPIGLEFNYGYCCDVMEHIPLEDVQTVIKNIMDCCDNGCFFQISTVEDKMGVLIGQQLHLTVQPHQWWKEVFTSMGYEVLYEQDHGDAAVFYVRSHNV
jgi:hypothetical protein